MKRLLVICGPTATGKTSLAASLAKEFNGVLISADSRQVYKGMDIGTGKERPKGVEVLGYDLVDSRDEFSLSQFVSFANKTIENIYSQEKLPILVGGTGLYIKGVVDGIETSSIPKNEDLRKSLEKFSIEELFEKLAQLDPTKAANMNVSDKKNPRRLIRAVEIAQHRLLGGVSKERHADFADVLFVGLYAPKDILRKLITKRIQESVEDGIEKEVEGLIKKGVRWDDQYMSSIGYRVWKDYFDPPSGGKKSKGEVIEEWIREEVKYASRQVVWFKRDERINWFVVSSQGWQKRLENLVKKWYSSTKKEDF